ncbi:MAG: NAD-binding protein, partial [Chloroflexi bacterium]|nr:NAD-binding protein [Chloroflexota bacterium]
MPQKDWHTPARQPPAVALVPRRVIIGIAFVCLLIVVGVVGFATLEHESILDALLTTVSAISTVGYSPPRPLSAPGKILAILLILGGLFGIALVISSLTEYFMEGHLYGAWARRRMDTAIANLRDHFIICGFGRVGREVAHSLSRDGVPFVVLDINEQAAAAARAAGFLFVEEDGSHDSALLSVGISRARGLIACGDSDSNNVYVTLTARAISPDIFIVARAAYPDAEPKLYRAGANRVVSPYVMAGRYMAQMAAEPLLANYVNLLFDGRELGVRIQEFRVRDVPQLQGRSVRDARTSFLHGAFVLAVDRGQERFGGHLGHV